MDKKKIMFELTRVGNDKFFLTKLPTRLPNTGGRYVFIDTNGKFCEPGYITAYFEDSDRGAVYIGNKLRYEKVVMARLYSTIDSSPIKSTWYLLYYDFKIGGPDTVTLDVIWCFSKYREKGVGENIYKNILDGLWDNIRQAVKNYKAIKYNASRI